MLSPNTDGVEAALPSITAEEADQLDRSTKRAKKVLDRCGTRSNARAGEPSQGRSGVADDPKVGYAAALLGSQTGEGSGIFLGGQESEEKANSMVDSTNPLRSRILRIDEELSCLRSRFGGCIIIKVLGRNIGYTMLKRGLDQLWSPIGHFDLVDLPNNFYAARKYQVEYEGLDLICFHCGRYEHEKETCLSMEAMDQVIGEGDDQEVEMTSPMTKQNESAKENIPSDSPDVSATAALMVLPGETMNISNNGPDSVVAQKEKGKGMRAAAGRPKVLPRKSVDQGLTLANPVQKPDVSAFTGPSIFRRSGYGRTIPLAVAQHQDNPWAQRAGLADAANLQVDKAAANSTCGESSRLVPDPDNPTLACEGLNDMEDDLPKAMHTRVRYDTSTWFLTVVYARPVERARLDLLRVLLEVSKQVTSPWLVLGDFNEIASAEEKRGGAPFDPNRATQFREATWNNRSGLTQNLATFREHVKEWNWDTFGHIQRRKNRALARHGGVQRAQQTRSNRYLCVLEVSLAIMEGATSISIVNETLLVLIPKIDRPETIHHFKPISLCNVSYKLVTKTIANQLQCYMFELVSLNQVSFVLGRQIHDNIVIAQELVHTIQRMRGGKKFITIKVDLEKAYDQLR
ncbi:hypothetical protein CRG98_027952 [Punica granatum]|uniref:Reverse transcriptase domain-containing protein n=1 Tax=Punica granatum TaxID=22663 RepID=A0A2I0J6Y6_PUNGR|nr:hypothetical protein CRG98_027952 [Punica granatum]